LAWLILVVCINPGCAPPHFNPAAGCGFQSHALLGNRDPNSFLNKCANRECFAARFASEENALAELYSIEKCADRARLSLSVAFDRRAVFGRVTSAGELILAHFILGKVNVFNSAA
jgi:hypothetical protein